MRWPGEISADTVEALLLLLLVSCLDSFCACEPRKLLYKKPTHAQLAALLLCKKPTHAQLALLLCKKPIQAQLAAVRLTKP